MEQMTTHEDLTQNCSANENDILCENAAAKTNFLYKDAPTENDSLYMDTAANLLLANRSYKSRIFAMLYSDRQNLLELYNALNGTNYDNPDILTINTLENAIYLTIQNDVSFIVDSSRLSLYEHQSTYNPNIPLRFLFYVSDLYSGITKDKNLYGTKIVRIPPPNFFVFYNGTTKQPDRKILKLSEAYLEQGEANELELTVTMLNINRGHNPKLMQACKSLHDYAEYVARVRQYVQDSPVEEAVERAITECIHEGVLKDFLEHNRSEAKKVSIYEYDYEKHMRLMREEFLEDGIMKGQNDLLKSQISKKLAKGFDIPQIADMLEEDEDTIRKLIEEMQLQDSE